jgi:hypothetical protein
MRKFHFGWIALRVMLNADNGGGTGGGIVSDPLSDGREPEVVDLGTPTTPVSEGGSLEVVAPVEAVVAPVVEAPAVVKAKKLKAKVKAAKAPKAKVVKAKKSKAKVKAVKKKKKDGRGGAREGAGRPKLFSKGQERHIASLIRKNGSTHTAEILAARGKLAAERDATLFPKAVKVSLPTLGRIAADHGVELHRGRRAAA